MAAILDSDDLVGNWRSMWEGEGSSDADDDDSESDDLLASPLATAQPAPGDSAHHASSSLSDRSNSDAKSALTMPSGELPNLSPRPLYYYPGG